MHLVREAHDMQQTKRCTKCGKVKALEDFRGDRRAPHGRGQPCRECTRAYARRKNREYRDQRKYFKDVACPRCGVVRPVRTSHIKRACHTGYCGRCQRQTAKASWAQAKAERERQKRLPVRHPDQPQAQVLPAKHPARQSAPRCSTWWQMFVAGPCAWCGETFVAKAASADTAARYCSKRCARAASKNRRGRFIVPDAVRHEIYERDGWTCQLCGDPVDPDLLPSDKWAATLDHIVCRSWTDTPDDSPDNLRLAHRYCNSLRGDEGYFMAA